MNTDAGAVNSFLKTLGIANPPDWLGDPEIAIVTVMLMMVWLQIGYPLVIFMAALGRVDPSLYEAADLDGASWFQQLRRITIPRSGQRSSSCRSPRPLRAEGLRTDPDPHRRRPRGIDRRPVLLRLPELLRALASRLRLRDRHGHGRCDPRRRPGDALVPEEDRECLTHSPPRQTSRWAHGRPAIAD
ncbi:carbohydrate ABC transporter permease [Brachybacterium sacelli]|uniref:carbohydrate ABC transporter permease n=1 Tax=Brachybacterium sacelli TaxID=173364 RepID=UPI0036158BC7